MLERKHMKLQYTDDMIKYFNWQQFKQNSGFLSHLTFRLNPFDVWSLKPYDTCFYKMDAECHKRPPGLEKLLQRLLTKESQLLGSENKTPRNIYKAILGHDLD